MININSFSPEHNYSDKLFVTNRRARIKTTEDELQIYLDKRLRGEDLSNDEEKSFSALLDLLLVYVHQLNDLTKQNQNKNTFVYGE